MVRLWVVLTLNIKLIVLLLLLVCVYIMSFVMILRFIRISYESIGKVFFTEDH